MIARSICVATVFLSLSLAAMLAGQTTEPSTRPQATIESTTQPVLKSSGEMKMHLQFLDLAKKGDIDLLFIGDSITDFWRRPDRGKAVWDQYFAPLKAANFGISGDRTQHVLWRIDNGELSGFEAKVIVLMLGTNNLSLAQVDSQYQRRNNRGLETCGG